MKLNRDEQVITTSTFPSATTENYQLLVNAPLCELAYCYLLKGMRFKKLDVFPPYPKCQPFEAYQAYNFDELTGTTLNDVGRNASYHLILTADGERCAVKV
jgi:hypothetical protein